MKLLIRLMWSWTSDPMLWENSPFHSHFFVIWKITEKPAVTTFQLMTRNLNILLCTLPILCSGAQAARKAAKRSPILIWETKGNPWVDFLMVIMASGIARGRVRTTTTTTATTTVESRKMAATLQIIGWQRHATLVYCVLFWYWTSMLWSIDTCQNIVSADQCHVTLSRAQVYSSSRSSFFEVDRWPGAGFSIGSRAHVWLTCWKQGRIVREAG